MCSLSVQPILALMGLPVSGNPSQYVLEKAFAHHSLDWRYISLEVTPEGLADAVRGFRALGLYGGHVATPHKEAILPLLDRVSPAAAAVGAVDFLTRDENGLVGDNLEGAAVVECLRRKLDPRQKRIVVAGTGRIARATALALAEHKPAELTIVARSQAPGQALVDSLIAAGAPAVLALSPDEDSPHAIAPGTDVLIDATAPGNLEPDDPRPLGLSALAATTVAADVTFAPPRTWLLREAAQRGCPTVGGVEIVVERLALAFQRWTGVAPDRNIMREAAEEFLEV